MIKFESNLPCIMQELIQKRSLTVSELARRTNIPQPTIYRIVHGEHQRPHKKTLQVLSEFFNITIDQLIGLEPIGGSGVNKYPVQIPILDCKKIANWPYSIKNIDVEYVIYERPISPNAFAFKMPDKSMEPMITKNTLLIIDPEKEPEYRNLVAVKLHNFNEVIVRQLIKDAGNCYIRPLNQDFDHFEMIALTAQDAIKGTVVEARLNCDGL